MKIVFVCTGNSCRSVMAHFMLNKFAADRGLTDWEARSCGIAAENYFQVPKGVREALAEKGIEEIKHKPQYAGREILDWADSILPMAQGHRDYLLDQYPEFTKKIQLFSEAAGWGMKDVADPIGQPLAVYRRCRDELEKGLESILKRHATQKS